MLKNEFYYNLPERLIAQAPADKREFSRLLVLDKQTGEIEHKHFYDIVDYLNEGDCLILNDTKVIPARLFGTRSTGAKVEFLLLKNPYGNCWETLAGPGKKAQKGDVFTFKDNLLAGTIIDVLDNGNRIIKFSYEGSFYEILDKIGEMPLPHYIHETPKDCTRYQTVYAKYQGSAAAPTAGLHFTDELLKKLEAKGVNIGFVTLHVGLGTFRPVKEKNIENHLMHTEHYVMPEKTAVLINRTKSKGNRVICVGTTSCRTVETVADDEIKACEGDTSIFIYPPYNFKCLDALITNFHLPESTLIMLVSALAGKDKLFKAYETAVEEEYRFFSFGDAMFIK